MLLQQLFVCPSPNNFCFCKNCSKHKSLFTSSETFAIGCILYMFLFLTVLVHNLKTVNVKINTVNVKIKNLTIKTTAKLRK